MKKTISKFDKEQRHLQLYLDKLVPFKVYSMMINMMQRVVTSDQDIQNLGAYESEQRSRF